jgi:UDP-N-acetyl-D-mannosaminuronate dehydrogenase
MATQSETRELINAVRYINAGMVDTAARAVSALYRSARSKKSQNDILAFGMAYGLVSLPEWIG